MRNIPIKRLPVVELSPFIDHFNQRFGDIFGEIDIEDIIDECQEYNRVADPADDKDEWWEGEERKLDILRHVWVILRGEGITEDEVLFYVDY